MSDRPIAASWRPGIASRQPNIVFLLWDNLAWAEVGCYGGGVLRGVPTPRIDSLAADGLKLLSFNVEAQCTPSRSAVATIFRDSEPASALRTHIRSPPRTAPRKLRIADSESRMPALRRSRSVVGSSYSSDGGSGSSQGSVHRLDP